VDDIWTLELKDGTLEFVHRDEPGSFNKFKYMRILACNGDPLPDKPRFPNENTGRGRGSRGRGRGSR